LSLKESITLGEGWGNGFIVFLKRGRREIAVKAAIDGQVKLQNFIEERISDPEIRALMGKIKARGAPEPNSLYPEKFPAEVEVTTENGRKFLEEEYYAKGSYKNPLTEQEFRAKFLNLAPITFPERQAQEIIDTV
jgi:2-methylcitrate dehydratase